MEEDLAEALTQIQELAGVALDLLLGGGEAPPEGEEAPPEGEPPPE